MSSRKVGGGRVLGSGRSLSPAQLVPPKRNSSLLSPSASSVSLESEVSNPQISSEIQDLHSKVSLEHGEPSAAAAAASSRLVCPICNEEMVTLLQLNRHLDDDHKHLEPVEQDEVKTWFKTRMAKAKRFQPLAVLNQKFKGLEVFESNDVPPTPPAASSGRSTPEPTRPDADEIVTRKHWQRSSGNDACAEPMCGKRLNVMNGNINCRKCGRLFCEEHTMYQMKLSRSAQHEPVRGCWCRVCETCYKSRDGYNDHSGLERDHTKDFTAIRRRAVDKAYLEVSRLEKRLTKLTQLLTAIPVEQSTGSGGLLWSLTGAKNQRKLLEQSVVTWEEDASISSCPFCQQEFSNYSFRRHHCRLCGRVVCGDPRTRCSTEIGLNVAAQKALGAISIDVRMCQDCKSLIFSKRDFANELANKPPDMRAYENLVQFERGIRLMLPKFQRLLMALQDPDKPPTSAQLAEASKIRKRLLDSFGQYDVAARRIRDMPTTSPSQKKLQNSIYQQATNFLHLHMLPLKTLPKILKHASPHGLGNTVTSSSRSNGALAVIKYNDMDKSSQASSSSAVSAMEAEEKELRERLIVLEEQKFMVSEMIADANKRRKFDEVSSLAQNVEDLSKEIDQVNGMLAQMDFAGAYGGVTSLPAT
ncbi:MAG: carboxypeptidase Y-deficient [Pycnora praestabilis]|nr:MAG: carboxypeptidase Y-deficient [Pycnora praestabilis]